jgi:hypothetical protein
LHIWPSKVTILRMGPIHCYLVTISLSMLPEA